MKNTRFKTDYRLWVWIALALFLASWFFPIILDKAGGTPVERIRWLVNFAAEGNTEFDHILSVVCGQIVFSAIASILLAWPIQVVVVVIRTTKGEWFGRIANPRIFFYLWITATLLMTIFPPWTDTYTGPAPGASPQDLRCSIGYSFVLAPEKPFDSSHTIAIDLSRLFGQWIGTALAGLCVWLYFRPNRRVLLTASGLVACVITALFIIGHTRARYGTSKELVDGHVNEVLAKMGGIKSTNGEWVFPATNSILSRTN